MTEGFRRSVDRLSDGASDEDQAILAQFLEHISSTCEVATTFERATPAYYRPTSSLELPAAPAWWKALDVRSEEHTSELQSLMRISYAVFCLKKKKTTKKTTSSINTRPSSPYVARTPHRHSV